MKAIVVHEYDGPEALKYEDVPVPTPKEDEMLIRVFAAGVNSFDGVLRSGKYAKIFKMQLPWIPGYDIAGIVEKVGDKVGKFKVGDPVYAFISIPSGGGYAEYALAKQSQVALKPATVSFAEAVKSAVVEAANTIRHLDWFEVVEQRGRIVDGKVQEFQVTIKVGFKIER